MSHEYVDVRRIEYGEGAIFVPVCEKCNRFVKADKTIKFNVEGQLHPDPNATCSKCGRTRMIFEGYY